MQADYDAPTVAHSSASMAVMPGPEHPDVWQLSKWLETEIAKFNAEYGERQLTTPLVEFLMLATRQARQLHSKVFYELTKQVGFTFVGHHFQPIAPVHSWLGPDASYTRIQLILHLVRLRWILQIGALHVLLEMPSAAQDSAW